MPSKLKKAIGAVKDQTSISLAKVSNTNASNVEVLILKATRHDEAPIDDRYVNEVLQLISSSKVYAVACVQVISRRIGKTRNWIVALKSLMLVLRIFQDGDPYFPRECIHAMKRGHKILNLSSFKDDSHSSPWDYTAFVRTFALYLDDRLDCFVTGKLQRRLTNGRTWRNHEPDCDMKPTMLLDKISSWQRLLDRAIGTRPTGAAKTNKLVQFSLYSVVQESFELYRDISDALALLLDSFFHLPYQSCVSAFQACVKASKQFEELCSFYDLCKSSGVGRTSEYPSVQKVSDELVETLQEFLKDQSSFPVNGRSPLFNLPTTPTNYDDPAFAGGVSSEHGESNCEYLSSEPTERLSDRESESGSHCTSSEDLMSVTELAGMSPSPSVDCLSSAEPFEKRSQQDDHVSNCATNIVSNHYLPILQGKDLTLDNLFIDGWPAQVERKQEQTQQGEQHSALDLTGGSSGGAKDDWELVLAETATKPVETATSLLIMDDFIDQASTSSMPQQEYTNPFLQDVTDISDISTTVSSTEQNGFPNNVGSFSVIPTFQVAPTFCASPERTTVMALQDQNDPLGEYPPVMADIKLVHSAGSQDQHILLQQRLWLENQNKIIAKRMA